MNPSKELWIAKFFKLSNPSFFSNLSEKSFYEEIRKTGFIYGFTTKSIQPIFHTLDLTSEERTKIVLLEALYGTYIQTVGTHNFKDFTVAAEAFYKKLNEAKTDSYFSFIRFESKKKFASLEKIINQRTTRSVNYFDKTFSPHLSNFLIFTDVLCFKRYLINQNEILTYNKYLENTLAHLVKISFNQKQNKTKYDEKIKQLIDQSLKYSNLEDFDQQLNSLNLTNIKTYYGKAYLYDMALMVLWNDEQIDSKEQLFVKDLQKKLNHSSLAAEKSLLDIKVFIATNKSEIPYFQFSHPIKKLYSHTHKTVSLLINRNKKALTTELLNNKVLMQLLIKTTHSPLTKKEKLQLKNQLVELGKTIPAFTIFLVPGGSLLLPILIKLLPEILPNSFNENK